jgi:hypothetical protein
MVGAPVGDHVRAAEDGGAGHPARRLQVHIFLWLKQPSLRVMLRTMELVAANKQTTSALLQSFYQSTNTTTQLILPVHNVLYLPKIKKGKEATQTSPTMPARTDRS